mgnify:CR=1 FL=1
MKPQPPCKDCEFRQLNCHKDCVPYSEYKQELAKYSEIVKKAKEIDKYQQLNVIKVKAERQSKTYWKRKNYNK